jgi:hypothetical protein
LVASVLVPVISTMAAGIVYCVARWMRHRRCDR